MGRQLERLLVVSLLLVLLVCVCVCVSCVVRTCVSACVRACVCVFGVTVVAKAVFAVRELSVLLLACFWLIEFCFDCV